MEPFYFGAESRRLFGVYHSPDAGAVRDAGVVLCCPMGQEYIRSHRAFRQSAKLLSSRGLHVLRFDFSCCGDSAGDCDGTTLERWADDISAAVAELKNGGVTRMCLIGLRLGATLATMFGARQHDVEAMVLWQPVVHGAAYLAELKKLHRNWLYGSFARLRRHRGRGRTDEVLGFPLPTLLARELKSLDLLALADRPANRMLIIETRNGCEGRRLWEHLTHLGARVGYEHIPWSDIWIKTENEDSKGPIPLPVLQYIADWTSEVLP